MYHSHGSDFEKTLFCEGESEIFKEKSRRYLAPGSGGLVAKSCLTLTILWTVACQAPLSMGVSRQEHWRGLSFPSPGDIPDPGIEPGSLALQADDLPTELYLVCAK